MKKFQNEAYGYIKDMFVQHNMVKRCVLSLLSIIIMGFELLCFQFPDLVLTPLHQ